MAKRKQTLTYYFSVEGETELWYLQWLQEQINACEESKYNVSIRAKVETDPIRRVKGMTITGATEIWHLSDFEGQDEDHPYRFSTTMDRLKKVKTLHRQVTYHFGYSNLTFDLWIALHKVDCKTRLSDRKQYLPYINRGYGESFESMVKYKQRDNFHRCLGKLTLEDVRNAVIRAKEIMEQIEGQGYRQLEYKGYRYYEENPSLEVWRPIDLILSKCNLN